MGKGGLPRLDSLFRNIKDTFPKKTKEVNEEKVKRNGSEKEIYKNLAIKRRLFNEECGNEEIKLNFKSNNLKILNVPFHSQLFLGRLALRYYLLSFSRFFYY